jgi:hypothetical protein
MSHQRFHAFEKIQVQLITLAAIIVAAMVFWPAIRPSDRAAPVDFLAMGNFTQAAAFAGLIVILAAACGVATVNVRPQAAMLATMIGAAGISLKSHSIRPLLWLKEDSFGSLFASLLGELWLLAAIMLVAALAAWLARRLVSTIAPGLAWKDPLADLTNKQRQTVQPENSAVIFGRSFLGVSLRLAFQQVAIKGTRKAGKKLTSSEAWAGVFACLALTVVISAILLLVFLQSGQRGQIIYAVFVSFSVATVIAHQLYPIPLSIIPLAAPIILGSAFYILAATAVPGASHGTWMSVPLYANVLPIDWITLGCGGVMAGFWFSSRIHENRYLEQLEAPVEE